MELFKLFGTIAIKNADANDAIDDTTDKASDSESKITSAFKKIGTAVATYFAVDKIKEFGLSCINAASDASAASSQFTQVFGDMESTASKSLSNIADDTGIQVNRMKGSYTQIAAFAKTTGMDTEAALGLADRAMIAVADSAAFYDRTLEGTTDSLQSFLKGNYENDAALGLSCTETTRNEAANKLYGKSFKDLSESQKQLTLLQMVEDANAASGALGQAARESDTWTNQTGNLQQAWTDFKAALGDNVLPKAVEVVGKMAGAVQSVTDKVPAMVEWFNKYKGIIAGVAAAVGILATAIGVYNTVQAVKDAMDKANVTTVWKLVSAQAAQAASTIGAIAPYVAIVAAIAAVIAIVVLLINNWDTVKEKAIELFNKLKEVWGNIKETISEKVEAIKAAISEKFEAAKETVTNIFNSVKDTLSTIWETIKNVVQVAIMFIAEIFATAFELITLPWRFIWENCKEYILAAWEAIKTAVSTALEAIKTTISNVWNAIVSFLSPILDGIKNTFSSIWNSIKSTVTTVVNTIKNTISNVWNSIKSTITAVMNTIKGTISSILNSIKSTFSSIWNGIKSTVSNVINGVKSTISSGLSSAFSTVSNVLGNIKNKFTSIFDSVKQTVSNAIEKVKEKFNFSWSLPKLKMPHVSISGEFSLSPPSTPKFGIEWYKKAMDEPYMFTGPSIFGVNPLTGQARGAGEAGDEIMIGKDTMLNMIRSAVSTENAAMLEKFDRLIELLTMFFPQVLSMMGNDIVLDDGTLVGRLAPRIDEELGKISDYKGRGN